MGTRTKRIPGFQLTGNETDLIGQLVHVVFWRGETRSGKVESISPEKLILADPNRMWYNRRRHTHHIDLKAIREVVTDQVVPW